MRFFCFILCAIGVHSAALAAAPTSEQVMLQNLANARAPLALSADGKWRFHVDARNVLHRESVSDAKLAQTLKLPWPVTGLAVARTGKRLVFSSLSSCIGIVDFDVAAPKLRWVPSGPATEKHQIDRTLAAPGKPAEHLCETWGDVLASVSLDGRLLATPSMVYDLNERRIVGSLSERVRPLQMQFVDNDTKLLLIAANLRGGYESIGAPSRLLFSLWKLSDQSLVRLLPMDDANFEVSQSFFSSYSRQTNAAYWIDTKPNERTPGGSPQLVLKQQALDTCNATSATRFSLPSADWFNLVVDPHGRWIAGVRELGAENNPIDAKRGFVEELLIYDLDSRKRIGRLLLRQSMRGLVASNDGSTIYGLTAAPEILDASHVRQNFGGDVIQFSVDLSKVTTPKVAAGAWAQARCSVAGEDADARSIDRERRPLKAIWSQPLTLQDNGCVWAQAANTLIMRDDSVWIHRDTELARVDTATGRISARQSIPHKKDACTRPIAAAGGLVRYQGDTLSLTPFDGDQAGLGRRIIDVRPGWKVDHLWVQGRAMIVFWQAKPGTVPRRDDEDSLLDMQVITYDLATMRQLASELAAFRLMSMRVTRKTKARLNTFWRRAVTPPA